MVCPRLQKPCKIEIPMEGRYYSSSGNSCPHHITSQGSKTDDMFQTGKAIRKQLCIDSIILHIIFYMSLIYWNNKLKLLFLLSYFYHFCEEFPCLYPCGKEDKHCWKAEIFPSALDQRHNVPSDKKLGLRGRAYADRRAETASLGLDLEEIRCVSIYFLTVGSNLYPPCYPNTIY